MNRFYVIGLDDNTQPHFSPEVLQVIASHRVFSGGVRHHEIVQTLLPEDARWIDIKVPLDHVFEQYVSHNELVIFASGDPLFFGFATTIQNRIPHAEIKLFPTFNSLQVLAHKLVMPYHDMRLVSLTGRPWNELDKALIEGASKIGILTDRTHTPATIAGRMMEYGYTNYSLYIGEQLGNPGKEKIRHLKPEVAGTAQFTYPNCLIAVKEREGHIRPFGIPDHCFALLNGREKMITKMPIRLLTLNMLELRDRKRFWDIGFCTGSVSIEAKLQFPHLEITAFEIREEGRELMYTNSRRFGTPGIHTVIGDFSEVHLEDMESPDAVFIGGHGGRMDKMVSRIAARLAPDGVLVFNSVSEESKALFMEAVTLCGMQIHQQTSITVDTHNTITILKAIHCPK